jgi:hypothetical protein
MRTTLSQASLISNDKLGLQTPANPAAASNTASTMVWLFNSLTKVG